AKQGNQKEGDEYDVQKLVVIGSIGLAVAKEEKEWLELAELENEHNLLAHIVNFLWHCKEPEGPSRGIFMGIDLDVFDIGAIDEGDFFWALLSVSNHKLGSQVPFIFYGGASLNWLRIDGKQKSEA
ncbi:hypothetical protein ACJX0J_009186, partial [Zea mays]